MLEKDPRKLLSYEINAMDDVIHAIAILLQKPVGDIRVTYCASSVSGECAKAVATKDVVAVVQARKALKAK